MHTIPANDLKRKGISAFLGHDETLVTIRGKACFIMLDVETYEQLREAELESAVLHAKKDIATGNIITESVAHHIKRIKKAISKNK